MAATGREGEAIAVATMAQTGGTPAKLSRALVILLGADEVAVGTSAHHERP